MLGYSIVKVYKSFDSLMCIILTIGTFLGGSIDKRRDLTNKILACDPLVFVGGYGSKEEADRKTFPTDLVLVALHSSSPAMIHRRTSCRLESIEYLGRDALWRGFYLIWSPMLSVGIKVVKCRVRVDAGT